METDFLTQFRTVDRKKIILSFFEAISWGKECKISSYSNNLIILEHKQNWYFPLKFSSKDFFEKETAMFLAFMEQKKPEGISECVIIDGDLNYQQIDYICNFLCSIRVTPFFVTAESGIEHSFWMARQLDGLDWNRTFQSFCEKGRAATPIMEWDK